MEQEYNRAVGCRDGLALNRRAFLKSVPALAAALTCLPVLAKVKRLPNSIMLTFRHRDNPERHGVWTWSVSCQRSYDQYSMEAVKLHALYAARGYDCDYREFSTLRFVNANEKGQP